ncbi:MAG: nucleoside/nucleotide kinase family protein [Planctomycetota bacterium]|jgi:pantothenate kinase
MPEPNRLTVYPQAWSQHLTTLTGSATLDVAGYETNIEVTEVQLVRVYFPLLAMLDELHRTNNHRIIAGLAGIPGSGKSTFTATLARIAQAVLQPKRLVVAGMDGWHWPNTVLDQRTIADSAGNQIPLRERKGCPQSFDTDVLADAVKQLQQSQHYIKLPVYDRQQHEPVPEHLIVEPQTGIVLVEGNYLLCSTPPWHKISSQLNPKLFLVCDPDIARRRIIERHIRGGSTPQQAQDKYQINDRANTEIVLTSAAQADLRIQFEPQPMILQP